MAQRSARMTLDPHTLEAIKRIEMRVRWTHKPIRFERGQEALIAYPIPQTSLVVWGIVSDGKCIDAGAIS